MTEAKWLVGSDPLPMLAFLQDKASERKVRLFTVACCRRLWPLAGDERTKNVIDSAELLADGQVDVEDPDGWDIIRQSGISWVFAYAATPSVWHAAECAVKGAKLTARPELEAVTQCDLLRDIFGNPFYPVVLSPSWRTDTAVSLARQMYESRDFSAMPILADALQDAGCDNDDILDHCRDEELHVRGCRVVDLVLGKS